MPQTFEHPSLYFKGITPGGATHSHKQKTKLKLLLRKQQHQTNEIDCIAIRTSGKPSQKTTFIPPYDFRLGHPTKRGHYERKMTFKLQIYRNLITGVGS